MGELFILSLSHISFLEFPSAVMLLKFNFEVGSWEGFLEAMVRQEFFLRDCLYTFCDILVNKSIDVWVIPHADVFISIKGNVYTFGYYQRPVFLIWCSQTLCTKQQTCEHLGSIAHRSCKKWMKKKTLFVHRNVCLQLLEKSLCWNFSQIQIVWLKIPLSLRLNITLKGSFPCVLISTALQCSLPS